MRQRVDGEKLVRDPMSKALLSTDKRAVEDYRRRRASIKSQEDMINSLKTEVQELKSIVQRLLEERK